MLDVDKAEVVGRCRPYFESRHGVERDVLRMGLLREDVLVRPK